MFTYRHYWGHWRGSVKMTLRWHLISERSRVFASITEGELGRSAGGSSEVVRFAYVGDAMCTVHNVASFDGGVTIWVTIAFDHPIPIFVDYLVIDP